MKYTPTLPQGVEEPPRPYEAAETPSIRLSFTREEVLASAQRVMQTHELEIQALSKK